MSRDITEWKKREEDKKRREDLERSNRELRQFAYISSHDLREPLRMVGTYAELLERRYHDKLDEDGNRYLDYIVKGATRMHHLIRDLLALSSLGTQELPTERVAMDEVVKHVLDSLKNKIEDSKVEIKNHPLPVVLGIRSQLTQLMQNLIENAIKFHGDRPQVEIAVRPESHSWLFSVSDNGIGFDQKYSDQIFTVFKRLHRDEYEGTGIGLATCKKVVEHHGGQIWAHSKPQSGSTFYFRLPRVDA